MTLKNDGRERKSKNNKKIKCPFCSEKLRISDLVDEGYIERFDGKSMITCSNCLGKFSEK
jgi:transcription elongation factor Elf1